jgi:hypothetical protein
LNEAMRGWPVPLTVLTLACTLACSPAVQPTAAKITPSPTQSTSPIPGDLPLSSVSFSCRLPIFNSLDTRAVKNAFISFPSRSVTIDPTGNGGFYFDRAFSTWLPVGRQAVSPDGTHYAFTAQGQQDQFAIHVVDVASGMDQTFPINASAAGIMPQNFVFDYAAEGIYLVQALEGPIPGMWLFDPTTGSIRLMTKVLVQVSVGGGIFWFGALNPADPNPVRSRMRVESDQIWRLDLKVGRQIIWVDRPGTGLVVIGVDRQGRPLTSAVHDGRNYLDPTAELLLSLDDATQRSIYKGPIAASLSGGITDDHGVWFGSPQGIYLYSDAGGLQKVSDQSGYPANGCF